MSACVGGLGYGPPGTGKTESAKQYARWEHFMPFLPEPLITFTGRSAMDGMYPYRPFTFPTAPLGAAVQECRYDSADYERKYSLIERLMLQIEHVLGANQMQLVTKDVVETAQQNLIIGSG